MSRRVNALVSLQCTVDVYNVGDEVVKNVYTRVCEFAVDWKRYGKGQQQSKVVHKQKTKFTQFKLVHHQRFQRI